MEAHWLDLVAIAIVAGVFLWSGHELIVLILALLKKGLGSLNEQRRFLLTIGTSFGVNLSNVEQEWPTDRAPGRQIMSLPRRPPPWT